MPFLVIPLAIMAGLAFTGNGLSSASGSNVNFCNANAAGCTSVTTTSSSAIGQTITYVCDANAGNLPISGGGVLETCLVADTCTPVLPSPVYCAGGKQYLTLGTSVTVSTADAAAANGGTPVATTASLTSQGANFLFAMGPVGFVGLVTVAVGLAGLAGLQVFGSGLSSESIHILFVMGLVMGLWVILGAIDGFLQVPSSPTSFFNELNQLIPNMGTELYFVLTLIYTLGGVGTVSRGS